MSTDARGCEVKGEKDGITWPWRQLSPLCAMNGLKLPKAIYLSESFHLSQS